jgi:hypothetical protein
VQSPHGIYHPLLSQAALAHLESLILFPEDDEDEEGEEPVQEALEDAPEDTKSDATPKPDVAPSSK